MSSAVNLTKPLCPRGLLDDSYRVVAGEMARGLETEERLAGRTPGKMPSGL